jgi:hypothetical protein
MASVEEALREGLPGATAGQQHVPMIVEFRAAHPTIVTRRASALLSTSLRHSSRSGEDVGARASGFGLGPVVAGAPHPVLAPGRRGRTEGGGPDPAPGSGGLPGA